MNRVAVLLISALCAAPAAAADWTLIAERSTLGFSGTYDGEAFHGRFARFVPVLKIDPAHPEQTTIEVTIDLASAGTENAERDETLQSSDFFWSEKFPEARFRTTRCAAGASAGQVACQAELTIRDKTVPVAFPFAFAAQDGTATLKAKVTLDRLAFDVGGGDWADEDLIPREVEVSVDLALAAKGG